MIDVSSIAHGSEPKVAPQSLFEFPYRIRLAVVLKLFHGVVETGSEDFQRKVV